MAIPPANILLSDASADWMKIGVPLVFQQDFMPSQFTAPVMVSNESSVSETGAADILRLKLEDRQSKIHITAEVVDTKTQKTTATQEIDANSASTLIPALDTLAKRLDQTAAEFPTKNTEALSLLTKAGSTQVPQQRLDAFKKAIALDPNFGFAYFLLLQTVAPAGPESYKDAVADAKAHLASFQPYDRARIQALLAQLAHAPLKERTASVEALLKVAPNDWEALSMIASVRFLNGDANAGSAALNKAIQLNPNNPSLKAELAEGLVQSKRFAEAEHVLSQLSNSPAGLAELATTILLEGDVKRATETAEKFITQVKNPDFQILLRATWSELSGDRAKALSLAETSQFTNPQIHGMALSEATVWRLMNKDFAGARRTADLGMKSDSKTTPITLVSSLLVAPDQSAEEWRKRVEASPLNPALKEPVLAYGFFLNGHYPEAAAEWRKAYDAGEGADLRVRAMLAASLDKAGNTAEAQKIKVEPFLIRDFADVYGAVAFSEMRRLTGLAH